MLVLSRKANESIQIGDKIRMKVIRIGGNRVHIGLNAPASVRILRGELFTFPPETEKEQMDQEDADSRTSPAL